MGRLVKKVRAIESEVQRQQWIYPWDEPGQSNIDAPSGNDPSDMHAKIPYKNVAQMGPMTHKMRSRGGEVRNHPGHGPAT